jgi:hypothetical protein
MSRISTALAKRRRERGYAILLVIFLATLMLILAMAAAPNILTEGRREKEKEMIWRGNQYVRGIKLYYRKMGRFPTSLDDLTQPKIGTIRFMRKAYKDPMNTEDGSWRLIYVGPAGQLIGSLRPPQTLKMPGAPGTPMGTPASTLAGGQNAATPPGGSQSGATGSGAPGTVPSNTDQNGGTGEIPSGETPTIMGGNIIGVGSKVNHPSVITYDKARNYRLFEFIWDPSKDPITLGGTGTQIGAPGVGIPGQTPFGMTPPGETNPSGQPPLNPAPPTSEPPTTDQNPPQS